MGFHMYSSYVQELYMCTLYFTVHYLVPGWPKFFQPRNQEKEEARREEVNLASVDKNTLNEGAVETPQQFTQIRQPWYSSDGSVHFQLKQILHYFSSFCTNYIPINQLPSPAWLASDPVWRL